MPGNLRSLRKSFSRFNVSLLVLAGLHGLAQASPAVLDTNLQLRLVLYTTNSSGAPSIRIAKDPRNQQLYYLK
jgi:hypothetical protein